MYELKISPRYSTSMTYGLAFVVMGLMANHASATLFVTNDDVIAGEYRYTLEYDTFEDDFNADISESNGVYVEYEDWNAGVLTKFVARVDGAPSQNSFVYHWDFSQTDEGAVESIELYDRLVTHTNDGLGNLRSEISFDGENFDLVSSLDGSTTGHDFVESAPFFMGGLNSAEVFYRVTYDVPEGAQDALSTFSWGRTDVGQAEAGLKPFDVTFTLVPEPSTAAVLVGMTMALTLTRRRR